MSMSRGPHLKGSIGEGGIPGNGNGSKRVYQVWKGSNKFFLGGRLVFGPDVRSLFLTLFLIITPIVVFCVFVGRHLMTGFPHHSGLAIVVVAVVHTLVVLTFLLLTSGRDPGIIPRNLHPPEPEEDAGSSSDHSGGHTPKLRLPRTKDVIVNGVVVKVKYCDTCMLYRPPRCSHCSICNNCVDRFDHHCPWVGQCIARRNYPYFFGFVSSAALLCLFIFAMCALRIKKLMDGSPPLTVRRALQKSPASGVLMAYAFLATWFVGGLTAFHLYLMSTNQTTYENFRYRYDKKINPYNKGVLRNIWEILFSRIPPSKVNFRAKAPAEVSGFYNRDALERAIDNMSSKGGGMTHGDIGMGERAWMPLPKPAKAFDDMKGTQQRSQEFIEEGRHGIEESFDDMKGTQQRSQEFIEEGRHGIEESFSEDFSKSLSHEYKNAKNGSYSGQVGWQSGNWDFSPSGNWDFSPELAGFTAGHRQGSK